MDDLFYYFSVSRNDNENVFPATHVFYKDKMVAVQCMVGGLE